MITTLVRVGSRVEMLQIPITTKALIRAFLERVPAIPGKSASGACAVRLWAGKPLKRREMGLFELGDFLLHSGERSAWKINCDFLRDSDWETLAHMGWIKLIGSPYGEVIGIPEGGSKLAGVMRKHSLPGGQMLIVDDVLTTGESMEKMKRKVGGNPLGLVVFARGRCPYWVTALFESNIR